MKRTASNPAFVREVRRNLAAVILMRGEEFERETGRWPNVARVPNRILRVADWRRLRAPWGEVELRNSGEEENVEVLRVEVEG